MLPAICICHAESDDAVVWYRNDGCPNRILVIILMVTLMNDAKGVIIIGA